ncbi:hypothetical protein FACS1894122_09010 [Alphaproteobacteria bacterium]|nr:hypothetical protein FACS1894122_09010 [Alphaproteobacteria bacterium]
MKKLIYSACVMIMMSSTQFEVQGEELHLQDVVNDVDGSAWNIVRLDGEYIDDPENIDEIFGAYANWADFVDHEGGYIIDSLHHHHAEEATAVAVLPDDGYDSVEHSSIFGGRAVWNAAMSVNEANEAMNREDRYHEYAAAVAKALRRVRWTECGMCTPPPPKPKGCFSCLYECFARLFFRRHND